MDKTKEIVETGIMIGLEFGYKECEKGNSLEQARKNAERLLSLDDDIKELTSKPVK